MNFKLIDDEIRSIKRHLDVTSTRNTEIENRLVAYLLVLISAQFELRIEALIECYLSKVIMDKNIKRFVSDQVGKILRAPNVGTITGALAAFNKSWKTEFHDRCGDQTKSSYDSIINNRHAFVHEARCNVTIGDLEGYFNNSRGIFSALIGVIGLRAGDISHLF